MGGSGGGHEEGIAGPWCQRINWKNLDAIDMQVAIVDRIKYNQESSNICIRILGHSILVN